MKYNKKIKKILKLILVTSLTISPFIVNTNSISIETNININY
jgi:plasmid maintenance system antidote protein VapI